MQPKMKKGGMAPKKLSGGAAMPKKMKGGAEEKLELEGYNITKETLDDGQVKICVTAPAPLVISEDDTPAADPNATSAAATPVVETPVVPGEVPGENEKEGFGGKRKKGKRTMKKKKSTKKGKSMKKKGKK